MKGRLVGLLQRGRLVGKDGEMGFSPDDGLAFTSLVSNTVSKTFNAAEVLFNCLQLPYLGINQPINQSSSHPAPCCPPGGFGPPACLATII